jgi:hypothetical protein
MTSATRTTRRLVCAAVLACSAAACAGSAANQAGPSGSVAITGEAEKFDVAGAYQPLAIDRVDGLGRENGRVVVKGPSGNVPIDVPDTVDMSQPNSAWRLVTESNVDDERRLTFTHETTLDNFTIGVPASQAELHYGAFLSKEGGSVLIFAWGDEGHCDWGYVTVKARH